LVAPRNIAVLVEAGKNIGGGHVQRMNCLVSQPQFTCKVILTQTPDKIDPISKGRRLLSSCYRDALELLAQDYPEVDVLVVDPPYCEENPNARDGQEWAYFLESARQKGLKTIFFTDENIPTTHVCDGLINDHPDAPDFKMAYLQTRISSQRERRTVVHPDKIRMLLGIRHFMIDVVSHATPDKQAPIFINFGGFDQHDALAKLAKPISVLSKDYPLTIVGANAALLNLQKCAKGQHLVYNALPRETFIQNLAASQFGITAAGNLLFERVHYNVPGVSLAQSEHQDTLGGCFASLGLTAHFGKVTKLDTEHFLHQVRNLLNDRKAVAKQRLACQHYDMQQGMSQIVDLVKTI
jgi:spore coat polysaccharide biosynthesis predicted glycosyltransferase SpsG